MARTPKGVLPSTAAALSKTFKNSGRKWIGCLLRSSSVRAVTDEEDDLPHLPIKEFAGPLPFNRQSCPSVICQAGLQTAPARLATIESFDSFDSLASSPIACSNSHAGPPAADDDEDGEVVRMRFCCRSAPASLDASACARPSWSGCHTSGGYMLAHAISAQCLTGQREESCEGPAAPGSSSTSSSTSSSASSFESWYEPEPGSRAGSSSGSSASSAAPSPVAGSPAEVAPQHVPSLRFSLRGQRDCEFDTCDGSLEQPGPSTGPLAVAAWLAEGPAAVAPLGPCSASSEAVASALAFFEQMAAAASAELGGSGDARGCLGAEPWLQQHGPQQPRSSPAVSLRTAPTLCLELPPLLPPPPKQQQQQRRHRLARCTEPRCGDDEQSDVADEDEAGGSGFGFERTSSWLVPEGWSMLEWAEEEQQQQEEEDGRQQLDAAAAGAATSAAAAPATSASSSEGMQDMLVAFGVVNSLGEADSLYRRVTSHELLAGMPAALLVGGGTECGDGGASGWGCVPGVVCAAVHKRVLQLRREARGY